MKYIISVDMEIPAKNGEKAYEAVSEFLTCINIAGKPVKFTIQDVKQVQPEVLQED